MAARKPSNRFYVYMLLRPDGTPFYVGKGCGYRPSVHFKSARDGERSHKAHIIRELERRGERATVKIIRRGLTNRFAFALEKHLIAQIGREPHGPLVNQTAGGDGGITGYRWKPHQLRKLRRVHYKGWYSHSTEVRERISRANRGKRKTEEHRRKLSEAARRRFSNPAERAKFGDAVSARWADPQSKYRRLFPRRV